MSNETTPAAAPAQQLHQIVEAAFAEAPTIYANGFVNGLGLTDAYIVLQTNGRSVAVVNLSLAAAKTLGQSLLEMVESFERETGSSVATISQLQDRAAKGPQLR